MNLEDKTPASKLHPVILQKLDDDDDQPMLRLHVVMPFHKGDPMSINVEANQISFVNLGEVHERSTCNYSLASFRGKISFARGFHAWPTSTSKRLSL